MERPDSDGVRPLSADRSKLAAFLGGTHYLPAGAIAFQGGTNEPVTVTFDVPGTYGVECRKQFGIGMVALVVVGEAAADQTVVAEARLPFRARERFMEMLEATAQ